MAKFFYSENPWGVSVVAREGEPLTAEEATAVAAVCSLNQLEEIRELLYAFEQERIEARLEAV